jgi:hypothetical protein
MELVRPAREWYDDRNRLADLADWLKEQGREPDDYGYFFRKPWKWTAEYQEMLRDEEQQRYLDEQDALSGDEGRWAL